MILGALVLLVVVLGLCFFLPIYLLGLAIRLTVRISWIEEFGASGIGACFLLIYTYMESRKLNGRQSINEQQI